MTTEIVSVSGSDFCGLGDFSLDLDHRGLVLVTGENHDTEAASSNGSNKSNLLATLPWCFFEKVPNGQRGDDVIRRGQKTAIVETHFERDGEPFIMRRSRSKGKRHAVVVDGVTDRAVEEDADRATLWMMDALALDYESFCATVFYAPGGRFFGDPDATDAERKALMHRVLNTGAFNAAREKARARASTLREKAVTARAKADAATRELERLNAEYDSARAKDALHAEEQERRARALEADAVARESAASGAARTAERLEGEVAKLRAVTAATQAALDAAKRARVEAESAAATAEAEAAKAWSAYDAASRAAKAAFTAAGVARSQAEKFASGICGECGGPVNPSDRMAEAEEAARKVEEAEAFAVSVGAVHTDRNNERVAKNAALDAARKAEAAAERTHREAEKAERGASDKVTTAKAAAMTAEATRAEAARLRESAAAERAKPSPWREVADAAASRREALVARAARATHIAGVAERETAHAEFWTRGFGPEGLPAFVLDQAVPEMEEYANRYLRVLSDGDIVLKTTSTSKTKGGEERERLGVSWEIEGVEGAPPSRAQEGKLKLATGLALMDIACSRSGQRPSLLMMDEVLDGFDPIGKQRVVRLLRDLRSRRSTILVVTHESSMADAFEHEVVVVKRGGVASVTER